MSFRCEGCNKSSHKPRIVTTKTRQCEHVELREGEYGALVPMIVGSGTQIVQQKKLCDKCVPVQA